MTKNNYSESFSTRLLWSLIVFLENSKIWKVLVFIALLIAAGVLFAIFI
ncbi:MAG: hypothetical protein V1928_05265 [Parcubacteria group bacterium]